MSIESATPGRSRAVGRWMVGLGLCLLPLIAIMATPLRADGALLYVGLLPAIVALTGGPRVAACTALATGLSVFAGLLLSETPWAAGVLMALLRPDWAPSRS